MPAIHLPIESKITIVGFSRILLNNYRLRQNLSALQAQLSQQQSTLADNTFGEMAIAQELFISRKDTKEDRPKQRMKKPFLWSLARRAITGSIFFVCTSTDFCQYQFLLGIKEFVPRIAITDGKKIVLQQ